MRSQPLLTDVPSAPVKDVAELYALAFDHAQAAARRYGELARVGDESLKPVRAVFEILEQHALHRARDISVACVGALNKQPDPAQLTWTSADRVTTDELAEFAGSSLATPYGAWVLAVRHRARDFVFWTYVAAHAGDASARAAAEELARNALHDAHELRRARRLAWRSELGNRADGQAHDGSSGDTLAARLEDLLLNDIVAWSRNLAVVERRHLLALTGNEPESLAAVPADAIMAAGAVVEIKRRAVRRAEQLSSIYLDAADRADDQARLELAQKLAAHAIARLAELRTMAAAPSE